MWILASRGRPENLKRFIKCWEETNGSTPVYVRLDSCDPEIENYKDLNYRKEFLVVIDSRARLGRAMNEMLEKFPGEPWYGLLADDLIPQTEYWDLALVEAASSNYIAQCNDLSRKPQNCCHPCIGGDLIRKVGWFALPECTHYCVELPWKELTKRNPEIFKYIPDVVVEHAHWRFDKAEFDNTYKELKTLKHPDHEIWDRWKLEHLDEFCSNLMNQ